MRFGSVFSGIGGIDLGLERAGMKCQWQIEISEFCGKVLSRHWPKVKRHGNICEVHGKQLESVDLVCGGFPCEDISLASGTGVGIIGERSGLWSEFARILGEVRPRFAFIENVPALRSRGLALVLQDLWALGFDAEWHCIPASALGAPHERDRIWIVAYPQGMFREAIIRREQNRDVPGYGPGETSYPAFDGRGPRWPGGFDSALAGEQSEASSGEDADIDGLGCDGPSREPGAKGWPEFADGNSTADADGEPLVRAAISRGERHAWTVEPRVVRMVYGVPHRVDRLAALGRAVVPQVAEWIGKRIMVKLLLK